MWSVDQAGITYRSGTEHRLCRWENLCWHESWPYTLRSDCKPFCAYTGTVLNKVLLSNGWRNRKSANHQSVSTNRAVCCLSFLYTWWHRVRMSVSVRGARTAKIYRSSDKTGFAIISCERAHK